MSNSIQVTERSKSTKSQIKLLRAQGYIPAVVYSSRIGSISISVEEKEILAGLRGNPHAILEVKLPTHGKKSVMVHEIQKDIMTGRLKHIDFYHINLNEKMDSMVTLHFSGEPKGVKEGGILQVEAHEVKVRCMPKKLPGMIEVDISELGIGDHLLVSDLEIQDGVEVLSEPNGILVTILTAQKPVETMEPQTTEEPVDAEKKEAVH